LRPTGHDNTHGLGSPSIVEGRKQNTSRTSALQARRAREGRWSIARIRATGEGRAESDRTRGEGPPNQRAALGSLAPWVEYALLDDLVRAAEDLPAARGVVPKRLGCDDFCRSPALVRNFRQRLWQRI